MYGCRYCENIATGSCHRATRVTRKWFFFKKRETREFRSCMLHAQLALQEAKAWGNTKAEVWSDDDVVELRSNLQLPSSPVDDWWHNREKVKEYEALLREAELDWGAHKYWRDNDDR